MTFIFNKITLIVESGIGFGGWWLMGDSIDFLQWLCNTNYDNIHLHNLTYLDIPYLKTYLKSKSTNASRTAEKISL